jgi:phosphoribosylformylglycinamidine synthase
MWEFSEVVDGMAEACAVFGTPITGGNVSFYNETFREDIYPTPVLGLVGLIENLDWVTTAAFRARGDRIVLIEPVSRREKIDLEEERVLQSLVSDVIREGRVRSAHDLSEGGLAIALAECCFSTPHRAGFGARISISGSVEICRDLFAEFPSRILVSTEPGNLSGVLERAAAAGLRATDLGEVGGDDFTIDCSGTRVIDAPVDRLESFWRDGLGRALENRPWFE